LLQIEFEDGYGNKADLLIFQKTRPNKT